MDAKGRLAIPARYRAALDSACQGHLVVTAHHTERCLLVYPEPLWKDVSEHINKISNIKSITARRLQRLLLGYATQVEMDANGRILLSPTLRDYAGLDKGLMITGVGDKLEIWNEKSWSLWLDESANADDLPDELPFNL